MVVFIVASGASWKGEAGERVFTRFPPLEILRRAETETRLSAGVASHGDEPLRNHMLSVLLLGPVTAVDTEAFHMRLRRQPPDSALRLSVNTRTAASSSESRFGR